MSTLAITTNVESPLSSPTLKIRTNPLDLRHDRKCRQEHLNQLNQIILSMRQKKLKAKKNEVYEMPSLIKQVIRCLYPSDIGDNICSLKLDVVFTLQTFIDLFRT